MNERDAVDAFRAEIIARGGRPPDVIVPGKLFRFATSERRGDDSGWAKLFADCRGGVIGNFREGEQVNWKANGKGEEETPEERAERRKQIKAAQEERAREEEKRHAKSAALAKRIWSEATAALADHPYLQRKRVAPTSTLREIAALRLSALAGYEPQSRGEELRGRILVAPFGSAAAGISTLEFVDEQGRKSALAGGAKAGRYWASGKVESSTDVVFIAEGIATALTISTAMGAPALAAGSCGNLEAVAKAAKARAPGARIVICGDIGNGERDAKEAAEAAGAALVFPETPDGTDFNDLQSALGLDEVRRQINQAKPKTAPSDSGHFGEVEIAAPPAERAQDVPTTARKRRPTDFTRDGQSKIYPNADNITLLLAATGHFAYDSFTLEVLYRGAPLTEQRFPPLISFVQGFSDDGRLPFAKTGIDLLWRCACNAAYANTVNSALDWLKALPKWDGKLRISTCLTEVFGAASDEYTESASRYFWLAMVRRMIEPGAQADMVPILIGAQGIGKTKALRLIGEERYASISFHGVGEKDWCMRLRGKVIVEIAELAGQRRAELETVKAQITMTIDEYRPPYGRTQIAVPRSCIFVGTLNPEEGGFLNDPTGARRFLPVVCGSQVNLKPLREARAQYFAEAFALLTKKAEGEFWIIPDAEIEQEAHRVIDPWEAILAEKIAEIPTASLREILESKIILTSMLAIPPERQHSGLAKRMAAVMRKLKYARAYWSEDMRDVRGFIYVGDRGEPDPSFTPRLRSDGAWALTIPEA